MRLPIVFHGSKIGQAFILFYFSTYLSPSSFPQYAWVTIDANRPQLLSVNGKLQQWPNLTPCLHSSEVWLWETIEFSQFEHARPLDSQLRTWDFVMSPQPAYPWLSCSEKPLWHMLSRNESSVSWTWPSLTHHGNYCAFCLILEWPSVLLQLVHDWPLQVLWEFVYGHAV